MKSASRSLKKTQVSLSWFVLCPLQFVDSCLGSDLTIGLRFYVYYDSDCGSFQIAALASDIFIFFPPDSPDVFV